MLEWVALRPGSDLLTSAAVAEYDLHPTFSNTKCTNMKIFKFTSSKYMFMQINPPSTQSDTLVTGLVASTDLCEFVW